LEANGWQKLKTILPDDYVPREVEVGLGNSRVRVIIDQDLLREATSLENNTVRKYAIGPAFAPGATTADIVSTIRTWVNDYKFTFLQPLLDGGNSNMKDALDQLTPTTPLEQDIVSCLRGILN
jgi:hypothetical protein